MKSYKQMKRTITKYLAVALFGTIALVGCETKKNAGSIEYGGSQQEHIEVVIKDSVINKVQLRDYILQEALPSLGHWRPSTFSRGANGDLTQYSCVLAGKDTLFIYRLTTSEDGNYHLSKKISY
nr:MAG TPA: LPP20 lipoprotein factor [Caudoviricetes sp.]